MLLPLAALCLILGLYPKPVLEWLEKPVGEVAARMQHAGENMPPWTTPKADSATAALETEASTPHTEARP